MTAVQETSTQLFWIEADPQARPSSTKGAFRGTFRAMEVSCHFCVCVRLNEGRVAAWSVALKSERMESS